MANIISLLEKLGAHAQLRENSAEQMTTLLNLDVAVEQLVAHLATELNVPSNLVCGIFPAETPDEEQSEEQPEEQPEDDKQPENKITVNGN